MNSYPKVVYCLNVALFSGLLLLCVQARSTPLSPSQVPLVLGGSIEPNVMFLLDDSGSMQWEFLPNSLVIAHFVYPSRDGVYGAPSDMNIVTDFDTGNILNTLSRSSFNNVLYYDRGVTYEPWVRADGSLFPDAPIDCAPHNPFDPSQGCRNLTVDNTETATWVDANGKQTTATRTFWPAVYWIYDGGTAGDVLDINNYINIEIRPANNQYRAVNGRTDCAAFPLCTYAEEIQNFANWYSYYRSRILAARAGAGRAFANQGSGIRVGFASINQSSATIDGVTSPGAVLLGVRPFSGTARSNFFDRLYGHPIPIAQTPLRRALDDLGQYFERSDDDGPWGASPGSGDSSPHLACRQSYSVIMSDGYWNGASAANPAAQTNVDDQSGPVISDQNTALNFQYSPVPPFRDDYANTLADVAMYYWNRDLRPDLNNEVPTDSSDPAFWQHLVDFTVGLGVSGSLNPATDLPALTAGSLAWPDPFAGQDNKIDDLWHAAVNSRGEFFNVNDTAQFSSALSNILTKISAKIGASAFVSLSSGAAGGERFFYLAEFNSREWSGRLRAFPINPNGFPGAPVWDSANAIDGQNFDSARVMLAYDPASDTGIPFRFSDLNARQQAALDADPASLAADGFGARRVDYLRGDVSLERRNNGKFRNRRTKLGDIVNSNPVFVGEPNNVFPEIWDDQLIAGDSPAENAVPFSGFRAAAAQRQRMVYFGANDGALHGVDAGSFDTNSHTFGSGTGRETIGYFPAAVIPRLNQLTAPNYRHRYYVDATPSVGEAFFGNTWHTVLGDSLGGGGQAVFALDITDPSRFVESNAANLVLWEFSDADDADLGNAYGQAVNIVRLHNGHWAAVFGNGYNNTAPDGNESVTGNAVLFIVDLETGSLIRKIDTRQGMAQDPRGENRPNGLSAAAPADVDGDFIADYVYAGDLFGNLWRFDLDSPNPAAWVVSFGGQALFKATDSNGRTQAVTVRPQIGAAPQAAEAGSPPRIGSIVYFGTGKYFEVGDNSVLDEPTQAFYGVWDKLLDSGDAGFSQPPFGPTHLLRQTIDHEILASDPANSFGTDVRVVSDHEMVWHRCAGLPSSSKGCSTDINGNPRRDYLGWRLDLKVQGASGNRGERAVADPVLRADRIIFTSLIPDSNLCAFGGTGFLMELDAATGARLPVQAFDLNRDGVFSLDDRIDVSDGSGGFVATNVSGRRSMVGTVSTPVIVGTGDSSSELLLQSGSTGKVEAILSSSARQGRLDWIQLP